MTLAIVVLMVLVAWLAVLTHSSLHAIEARLNGLESDVKLLWDERREVQSRVVR